MFCAPGEIEKETLPIPKRDEWYRNMLVLPNSSFGETLVAAGMRDRWKPGSLDVLIYVEGGVGKIL
ncbi:hypothetical protein Hanom_Chr06g00526261 [Helianthus anomalus]